MLPAHLSFVYIMDTYFSVPILSVIKYENVLSPENVGASIMMALFFAAMAQCIGMMTIL